MSALHEKYHRTVGVAVLLLCIALFSAACASSATSSASRELPTSADQELPNSTDEGLQDPADAEPLDDAPESDPAPSPAAASEDSATPTPAADDAEEIVGRDWTTSGLEPVRPQDWTPIMVDQFGYLPSAPKVSVLVDPQSGFNADISFTPGDTVELRRTDDGTVIYSAAPVAWNGGQTDAQSGDRGWWFDFSTVSEPGEYVVVDVASGISSHPFAIGADVYDEVLDVALRSFWYNRGNTAHPARLTGAWAGEATLVGPNQDTEARWVDDRGNDDTARDLSGGWYDAGDTNKYVTFAASAVHQMLGAYEAAPSVFDDEVGIPESGNGVPDILDEIRWELEWVEKMQQDDGGVLLKVGFVDFNEPRSIYDDTRPRFYEEACSSSSIAAASMFAHGAVVFADFDPAWSERLTERAQSAHAWFQANDKRNWCDDQIVKAGDADMSLVEQDQLEVVTAIYLFDLTGDPAYFEIIRERMTTTNPWTEGGFGQYDPEQAIAIAHYRSMENADPGLLSEIDARLSRIQATTTVFGWDDNNNLYRSFMADQQYHWGSNMVMANTGNANLALLDLNVNGDRNADFSQRAGAQLSTLHGVNPLGLTYLTNMGAFGAERSVTEVYHFLYKDGSDFDSSALSAIGPAPGYLAGGPNASYSGLETALNGQPSAKSYFDWNTSSIEARSWEISEPAIYYQSAYIRLLSGVINHGQ